MQCLVRQNRWESFRSLRSTVAPIAFSTRRKTSTGLRRRAAGAGVATSRMNPFTNHVSALVDEGVLTEAEGGKLRDLAVEVPKLRCSRRHEKPDPPRHLRPTPTLLYRRNASKLEGIDRVRASDMTLGDDPTNQDALAQNGQKLSADAICRMDSSGSVNQPPCANLGSGRVTVARRVPPGRLTTLPAVDHGIQQGRRAR